MIELLIVAGIPIALVSIIPSLFYRYLGTGRYCNRTDHKWRLLHYYMGIDTYWCERCGETKDINYCEKLGHAWGYVKEYPKQGFCIRCGERKNEENQ